MPTDVQNAPATPSLEPELPSVGSPSAGSPSAGSPSASLPSSSLRTKPTDFIVDELPAYPASGEGHHLFVTFRKTGLNSAQAVKMLAASLGVDARGAGIAGNKDKHAVTTQTASFLLPVDHAGEFAEVPAAIEVLESRRHGNKLKTGHLRGNRFRIILRDIAEDAFAGIEQRLQQIIGEGVPNAYGAQRFGRGGDNVERATAWICRGGRAPRDKRLRRLLFSSLQSELFNQVLAQRVKDGSWATVQLGDVAQKHDSGGVFTVDDLAEAQARAAQGLISATGPMFGSRMRWPEGQPGELERAVLAASELDEAKLSEHSRLGRGARRVLRLWVETLTWSCEPKDGILNVSFVLPKGAYATTVLSQVCRLVDVTRQPAPPKSSLHAATPTTSSPPATPSK